MTFDILIILAVVIFLVIGFLLVRTAMFGKGAPAVTPVEGADLDAEIVANHLADLVRCQTISYLDRTKINPQPFLDLHAALEKNYPRAHATLTCEVINQYSLLYTWPGTNPQLEPVLYASHLDVVPVDEAALQEWQQPPFEGKIVDDIVWGRGTLDTKATTVAAFEAVEHLICMGFKPQRTIYLAFGHDEEIGGTEGAAKIAALLKERNIHLAGVVDEGGAIMQGFLPGINAPTAMVGIGEKGYLTVELSAPGPTGHSATPPRQTAIGILAAGIARLEAARLPVRMRMISLTMSYLGSNVSFILRLAFANQWLFRGLIEKRLSALATTNASARTTTAVTMISGGIKDNILPSSARAAVNFRLMPGDSIAQVCEHIRKAIRDERVQLKVTEARWEASPVSSHESALYFLLAHTIRQLFPAAVVAPYLVIGATDSRYYAPICDNVYRFSPFLANQETFKTIHAANERISINALLRMAQFYVQLMKNWNEDVK